MKKIVLVIIILLILFVLIQFKINDLKLESKLDIIAKKSLKEHETTSIRPISTILKATNHEKLFFSNKMDNISICKRGLLLKNILLVTSHPANHKFRSSIRYIFNYSLQKHHLTRVVFLLGHVHQYQDQIKMESYQFGDILQGNFEDTIQKATYKHLMGLSWASSNCKHVNYLIKINDDIVVSMFKMAAFLNELTKQRSNLQSADFLAGFIKEFHGDFFNSSYLSGCFYVTTPQTARRLVETGIRMQYFWRDDVFITGLIAKHLAIHLVELDVHLLAPHQVHLICCMDDIWLHNIECDFLVGPSHGDAQLFTQFNRMTAKCVGLEKKCVKRKPNKKFIETCDILRFMKRRGISFERRFIP